MHLVNLIQKNSNSYHWLNCPLEREIKSKMVVICMEIWCLAPYLPGVQAVSAHKDPQHCSYSGVCLCQIPQPSEENRCSMPAWLNLTEETSTWQWIKLWTQGCLLLIQHGTLHHWGGQTTKGQTTFGLPEVSSWHHFDNLSTSWSYLHWIACLSVIYIDFHQTVLERKGWKTLHLLCLL